MNALVDNRNVHSVRRDFIGIAVFLGVIWVVFGLDRFLPLEKFGLVPRDASGLIGIIAMPFLHGDWSHLVGNSIPLAVTLLLLAGSRANSWSIVFLIVIIGGVLLWIFGREALHIGASGLVFGLIAFHLFAGIFEKRFQSILIAAIVGLLYASTLIKGVLPLQEGVSWDGHLFGAAAGALVALIAAKFLKEDAAASMNSDSHV